jgi:hypothetical protein
MNRVRMNQERMNSPLEKREVRLRGLLAGIRVDRRPERVPIHRRPAGSHAG